MSTQTPTASPDSPELDSSELSYLEGLYREGFDLPAPAEQSTHFNYVSELIGDIALSESLRAKAWEERQLAESFVQQIKTERAIRGAIKMEQTGFAEVAPTFAEQSSDIGRKNRFIYNNLPSHVDPEGWEEKETTEAKGLDGLNHFLQSFLDATKKEDGTFIFPNDAKQAQSISEYLTFMGEKEYDEGVRGLGQLWKAYLDGDPGRKLCVITGISNSKKYPGKQKSDQYLKQRIMGTFSQEDLDRYSNRIVDNLDVIQDEAPDNVRVVLLDDWAISGRQLARVYRELADDLVYQKFLGSIEANLLAASGERISHGLEDPDDPSRHRIPVKAYFKSHSDQAHTGSESHITGVHSTVNFGFGVPIEKMAKRLQNLGIDVELPALASVVSPYKRIPKSLTQASENRA